MNFGNYAEPRAACQKPDEGHSSNFERAGLLFRKAENPVLPGKNEVIVGKEKWWSRLGSNQRPPQCHCGALPTELRPHQMESDCMDSP